MTCTGWMGPPSTCCATWAGTGAGMAAGCCGFARCAGKDWSPGRCWPPSWPIWDGTCRLRRCRCRHSASRRPSSCLRPSSGRRSRAQGGEPREPGPVRPTSAGPGAPPWPDQERALLRLGEVLFAQTGGQPLYLLETLKLWRERQWLVPQLGADGTWKLEPTQDLAAALAQDLMRDVVYTELGAARRQVLHQRALARLESEGVRASELAYHARVCGEAQAAYGYSVQAGDEAMAVFAVADAIRHYQQGHALLQQSQPMQSGLPASEVDHLYASLGRAYSLQYAWQLAQLAYEELLAS